VPYIQLSWQCNRHLGSVRDIYCNFKRLPSKMQPSDTSFMQMNATSGPLFAVSVTTVSLALCAFVSCMIAIGTRRRQVGTGFIAVGMLLWIAVIGGCIAVGSIVQSTIRNCATSNNGAGSKADVGAAASAVQLQRATSEVDVQYAASSNAPSSLHNRLGLSVPTLASSASHARPLTEALAEQAQLPLPFSSPVLAASPLSSVPLTHHGSVKQLPPALVNTGMSHAEKRRRKSRRKSVQWQDGISHSDSGGSITSQTSSLTSSRTFDKWDPPIRVSSPGTFNSNAPDTLQIIPYESAAAPQLSPSPLQQQFGCIGAIGQESNTSSLLQGPRFYNPQQNNIPDVNAIRIERERFQMRPDTPDLDRLRRIEGLREAGALLGPPRDHRTVAIG
jgi:hypothetical protein